MQFKNLEFSTKFYGLLAIFITAIAVLSIQGVTGETIQTFTSGNIDSNPLDAITGRAAETKDVETTAVDSVNLQKGLQGYYRFDNPKSSTGYSLEFDGKNDYVETKGLGSGFSNGFSFSYWTRPVFQGSGNYNYHISYESGTDSNSVFRLEQDDDATGELDFGVYNNSGSWVEISSTALKENEWNHVGGHLTSAGTMELFVNGKSQGKATVTPANDAADHLEIAARHGGTDNFNGKLDEIRIHNNVLNTAQIQAIYKEKQISTNGLVLYQDFNGGPKDCVLTTSNSCLTDDSRNSNSGTPYNFNDNNLATGSGWTQVTPLNRPKFADYSGKSHTGTSYGGNNGDLKNFGFNSKSGWIKGKIGDHALQFDGSNDYVDIGDVSALNLGARDLTISAWIKMNEPNEDRQMILSKSDDANYYSGFDLRIDNGVPIIQVHNRTGGKSGSSYHLEIRSSKTISDGAWHHIAGYINRDSRSGKIFIDGVESTGSVNGDLAPDQSISNGKPVYIGTQTDRSHWFNGTIDSVSVYDRVLSTAKIKSLSNKESVSRRRVAKWNFESGDRSTAYDTSNLFYRGILGTSSVKSKRGFNLSVSPGFEDISTDDKVSVSAWYRSDQYKFGDGTDGSVTVSSETEIDTDLKSNGRSYPDAVNYVIRSISGTEVRTFSTPKGIRSGDQIILVNLQGTPSNYGNVGEYSFKTVESLNKSRNRIYLEDRVSNYYGNPEYQNIVVQRVPGYKDLTVEGGELTVSDWGETDIDSCPNGWTHHSGECYTQVTSDTWSNVRTQCRDYGGELARIDNSTVNSFIANNYPDSWIGFRDISGPDDSGNDGNYEWVWTFGDYYNYKNFASGEPSINGTTHNPTVRIGSGGAWYSEYGQNNSYPGVCEMNKKKGGVLAFRASSDVETTNGGIINATGKGYIGGDCSFCGDDSDGRAGEGIAGTGKYGFYSENANLNGGAGSYVNNNNGGDPAGGGGYGGPGQDSSNGQNGGTAIGSSELDQIYFGGGGGSGSDNDNAQPYPEDSDGGGIIYIQSQRARTVNISNEGIDGKTYCGSSSKAQSGGGAGGTIYLVAQKAEIKSMNASGGTGIYDGEDGLNNDQCLSGERSGDGGNGRIRINSVENTNHMITPQPYHTGLIPNLVNKKGEFGIGGYRDIAFGNINNKSAAVDGFSGSKWRNVVLTFDGSQGNVYVGGESGTAFSKTGITGSQNYLDIGHSYKGKIDEVRVYNRSLSEKEVQRLAFQ